MQYLLISREQRAIPDAGRGDDELIGRITVKWAWQLSRVYNNSRRQFQQSYAWIGQGLLDPFLDRALKRQPPYSTSFATSQQEMMLTPRWD